MSPSHGSRLEDMWHLWVDSLVIAKPVKVGTVAYGAVVRVGIHDTFRVLARQEERQPFIIDNVLVSSDGELASTVEQPLVLFKLLNLKCLVGCMELSCPELMHTEPQDSHGQQERVLITTRVSNS